MALLVRLIGLFRVASDRSGRTRDEQCAARFIIIRLMSLKADVVASKAAAGRTAGHVLILCRVSNASTLHSVILHRNRSLVQQRVPTVLPSPC